MRLPSKGWYFAQLRLPITVCLLALGLTVFVGFFGAINPEDSSHFSFSIAAGTSLDGWLDGPRKVGTYSEAGVPLYDALQGVGARLPYKGSWYASIEWPMRLIADWKVYVLARVFLATATYLFLLFVTIKSWRPKISSAGLLASGTLSLSPSLTFLRWEEWPAESAQLAATLGIVMFLLRKDLYLAPESPRQGLFTTTVSYFLVSICLSHLLTGHPGVLPVALSLLLPLLVASIVISKHFRLRVLSTLRHDRGRLLLLSLPTLWVLGTLIWELRSEAATQEDWSVYRSGQAGEYLPDQAFIGVTRGLVPPIFERVLSIVYVNSLQPLSRILLPIFPSLNFLKRSSDALPYGGFTGLAALVVAVWVVQRLSRSTPLRQFTQVVCIAQLAAMIFVACVAANLIPLELKPSGAYKLFLFLLPLNILVSIVLLSERAAKNIATHATLITNLSLGLVFLVVQLGFINAEGKLELPNRNEPLVTNEESRLIPGLTRTAMVTFSDSREDNEIAPDQLFGFSLSGRSFMHSAAQIRNTNNMVNHVPTAGGFGPINVAGRTTQEVVALLDFLQVESVLIESSNRAQDFVKRVNTYRTSEMEASGGLQPIELRGFALFLWSRVAEFSDFTLSKQLSDNDTCPILRRTCPLLNESVKLSPLANPRLTTCNDPCLWKYRSGTIDAGRVLVLPVTYDDVLRVRTRTGKSLTTTNVGGFLGVRGPLTSDSTPMTVTVSPDLRMLALIAGSYLALLSPFSLVVLCLFQRRIRNRN